MKEIQGMVCTVVLITFFLLSLRLVSSRPAPVKYKYTLTPKDLEEIVEMEAALAPRLKEETGPERCPWCRQRLKPGQEACPNCGGPAG